MEKKEKFDPPIFLKNLELLVQGIQAYRGAFTLSKKMQKTEPFRPFLEKIGRLFVMFFKVLEMLYQFELESMDRSMRIEYHGEAFSEKMGELFGENSAFKEYAENLIVTRENYIAELQRMSELHRKVKRVGKVLKSLNESNMNEAPGQLIVILKELPDLYDAKGSFHKTIKQKLKPL